MEEATSSDHKRKLATHKRTYHQSNAGGAGVVCTHLVTCSIFQVVDSVWFSGQLCFWPAVSHVSSRASIESGIWWPGFTISTFDRTVEIVEPRATFFISGRSCLASFVLKTHTLATQALLQSKQQILSKRRTLIKSQRVSMLVTNKSPNPMHLSNFRPSSCPHLPPDPPVLHPHLEVRLFGRGAQLGASVTTWFCRSSTCCSSTSSRLGHCIGHWTHIPRSWLSLRLCHQFPWGICLSYSDILIWADWHLINND